MWGLVGGLIGAGAQLIGGAADRAATANLNRKNRRWQAREQRRGEKRAEKRQIRAEGREADRYERYSDPAYVRERAEAAGFNPLLFTGQASGYGGSQPDGGTFNQGAPAFAPYASNGFGAAGNSIAAGFASLDDANMHAEEMALRATALEMENERLQTVADRARFAPRTPGILEKRADADGRVGYESNLGSFGKNFMFLTNREASEFSLSGNPMDPEGTYEEGTRRSISEGGSPGNENIGVRPGLFGGDYNTINPGIGQMFEDDSGELVGSLEAAPYAFNNLAHNIAGHKPVMTQRGLMWHDPQTGMQVGNGRGGWGGFGFSDGRNAKREENARQYYAEAWANDPANPANGGGVMPRSPEPFVFGDGADEFNPWWSEQQRAMGIQ